MSELLHNKINSKWIEWCEKAYKSSGVLIQQAIGAVCRCSQCIGDIQWNRIIGESLAQIDRLIFHCQLNIFVPWITEKKTKKSHFYSFHEIFFFIIKLTKHWLCCAHSVLVIWTFVELIVSTLLLMYLTL